MTSVQREKLDALVLALPVKKQDNALLIDNDTHREWIELMHSSEIRFAGGVTLGLKDSNKLDVLHEHYLGT